jgi:uncharacterized protein (UPF0332 family)
MTDENRAAGIGEELARAESALAASNLLSDGGFPSDAVSRLYYSLLEPEASHLFSRLMKYGEEADYNPSYVFTTNNARTLRDETAALASRIAELIRQSGYLTGGTAMTIYRTGITGTAKSDPTQPRFAGGTCADPSTVPPQLALSDTIQHNRPSGGVH